MGELRHLRLQRAIDVDLARRVVDVVVAAHHVSDRHVEVVDHHREVVGRHQIGARDHQIVECGIRNADVALDEVRPRDVAVIGIAKADHRRDARGHAPPVRILGPPAAVVARLQPLCALLLAQSVDLLTARVAAIGTAVGKHLFDRVAIARQARGLANRPLVVIQAQPGHAVEDDLNSFFGRALQIGILDAQHEFAAVVTRVSPCEQRRAGVAQMQKPGGAGSESGADLRHELWPEKLTRDCSPRDPAHLAPCAVLLYFAPLSGRLTQR